MLKMIKMKNKGESLSMNKIILLILILVVVAIILVLIFNPDLMNALRNQLGYGTPDDKDIEIVDDERVPPPPCPVRVGYIEGESIKKCKTIEKTDLENPGKYCDKDSLELTNLLYDETTAGNADIRVSAMSQGIVEAAVQRVAQIGTGESGSLDVKVGYILLGKITMYGGFLDGSMDAFNPAVLHIKKQVDVNGKDRCFVLNMQYAEIKGHWICRDEVYDCTPLSEQYVKSEMGILGLEDAASYGISDEMIKQWNLAYTGYGMRIVSSLGDDAAKIKSEYYAKEGFSGEYFYSIWDVLDAKGVGWMPLYYFDEDGKKIMAESYVDAFSGTFVRKEEKNGRKYFFGERYFKYRYYDDDRFNWDSKWYNHHTEEKVDKLNNGEFIETDWVKIKGKEVIRNYGKALGFSTGDSDLTWIKWKRVSYTSRNAWIESGTSGSKIYVKFATSGVFYEESPWIMMDYFNYYGRQAFLNACKENQENKRKIFLNSANEKVSVFDSRINGFCIYGNNMGLK